MPRYFFDLTDGERMPDVVGIELPDDAAARSQAVLVLAGAIMPGSEAMRRLGDDWLIECLNEARELLFVLQYRKAAGTPGVGTT